MKTKVKMEKAFTSVDMTIAMLIIIIFVSITTSLIYSTYTTTTEARRTAEALNYGVDVFETIGAKNYSEIPTNADTIGLNIFKDSIQNKIDKSYTIDLSITEPYVNQIKQIDMTITYKVSAKETQSISMQRIKIVDT